MQAVVCDSLPTLRSCTERQLHLHSTKPTDARPVRCRKQTNTSPALPQPNFRGDATLALAFTAEKEFPTIESNMAGEITIETVIYL